MKKGEKWKMKNWDCSIFHSLKVVKDSLTQKAGLLPNDFLISVAGVEVYEMTHDQVTFNETKISRQKIWWRGKKIWQKLLSGGAFDPEGRRQVHHGHWTVSERKQGWKVVKRKRVSDELPVTCAAGLHVEIHESCAPCQLLNMWLLLLVQVSQNFPFPPKGAKVT